MNASRWRAAFGVSACSAIVAVSVACSSSDFQTAPADDTGTTADTTSGDATDSKPLCIVPPAATGSENAFCTFQSKVSSRCGQCEDCRQTNENGCVQFGGALSAAFKQALVDCEDVLACGENTSYVSDKCVAPKLAAAAPTDAQKAARDAYCAACPANLEECKNYFDVTSFTGGDAGADAGNTKGAGAIVLIASDEIANTIATACKGGLNCNVGIYQLCSVGKFCNRVPPDSCNKGFCGK